MLTLVCAMLNELLLLDLVVHIETHGQRWTQYSAEEGHGMASYDFSRSNPVDIEEEVFG